MWDFHLFLMNGDPNMKRKRFSKDHIISILKQHEASRTMVDLAREHGIAVNTLYRWKSKFGGMEFRKPYAYGNWRLRMLA